MLIEKYIYFCYSALRFNTEENRQMEAKFEPNRAAAVDADEVVYEDPIALKRVEEMEEPVLTPSAGHIYDRVDIEGWIEQKGTDPVFYTPLTVGMLVPGRFVKPLATDAKTQRDAHFIGILAKMQETIERNKAEADQAKLTADQDRQENAAKFQKMETTIQSLKDENFDLRAKLHDSQERERALTEENKRLKAGYVNPAYIKLGSDVENKLKKGSTHERHAVLEAYAKTVKSSTDDETLRESVNDVQIFLRPEVRRPRLCGGWFSWFGSVSETTQVATELRDKINMEKGFTS